MSDQAWSNLEREFFAAGEALEKAADPPPPADLADEPITPPRWVTWRAAALRLARERGAPVLDRCRPVVARVTVLARGLAQGARSSGWWSRPQKALADLHAQVLPLMPSWRWLALGGETAVLLLCAAVSTAH